MKKHMKKRSGFTLVELLIVIIIIGILAGAMLLVAGSGTDKAEATKIISDLRGLKAAALMYYADKPTNADPDTDGISALKAYMDRPLDEAKYDFLTGDVSGDLTGWFVGRINDIPGGVQEKLAAVAGEIGLLAGAQQNKDGGPEYKEGTAVYMRAR